VTGLYRLHCVLMSNVWGIASERRIDSMANAARFNRRLLNGRSCIDIAKRVYAPALVL
jgi:hypothetical protein